MPQKKYWVYELSARAILANAEETSDGVYTFCLNATATEKCRVYSAPNEQDDNALFYQNHAQRTWYEQQP